MSDFLNRNDHEGPEKNDLYRVNVRVPVPVDRDFSYLSDRPLPLGALVAVPFGPRTMTGVIWDVGDKQDPNASLDVNKLKHIKAAIPEIRIPDAVRQMVDWVARYTLTARGDAVRLVTPPAAVFQPEKPTHGYLLMDPMPAGLRITPQRQTVIDFMAAKGLIVSVSNGSEMANQPFQNALSSRALQKHAEVSAAIISGLEKAGALIRVPLPTPRAVQAPKIGDGDLKFTDQQLSAIAGLRAAFRDPNRTVAALDGITGSGKTEVYFELINDALKAGRQVLVLVPEIALTEGWIGRFKDRFGVEPGFWHSSVPVHRKARLWRGVANGDVPVVVGARSALGLPFPDLGLIVVDEEHDSSFKQQDGLLYHARDAAIVLATFGQAKVLLASATPSLETVRNGREGKYAWVEMRERVGQSVLPTILAVDICDNRPAPDHWLTPPVVEAMAKTIEQGQQSMVFLNRRGFAPLILCRSCGHRIQCDHCSSWLTLHRLAKEVRCHHCGFQTAAPETCPQCGESEHMAPCGPGVERLADEVVRLFPEARLAVASSDTLGSSQRLKKLLDGLSRGTIDIVIGTQILAKGHHFPGLTHVVVVDADLSLYGGDPRASEKTFQMLQQVAGRAGRGVERGLVQLQTAEPDHPVIQALLSNERDQFYDTELEIRSKLHLPPYARLAALVLSDTDENRVDDACRQLAKVAPRDFDGVDVFGPAPAPIPLVRGRHRRRFLMRCKNGVRPQGALSRWLDQVSLSSSTRLTVDIDPYHFL